MDFKLKSDYKPTGDQPQAIKALVDGFKKGNQFQTLLGVTGSGKTFTMANVIQALNKGFIKGYEADLHTAVQHPVPEEGFCGMEIKGRAFAEKKDAGEMLLAVCKQYQGDRSEPIGTYRGFQMELSFDALDRAYKVALKGQMTHQITLGQDAYGNITRLDNAIAGIEKRLQGAKDHLESLYHDQENAKAEVGKPFPQEEELKVKSARLIELDTLLNMDERGAEPIAGEEFGDLDDEPGGDTVGDGDDEPGDTDDSTEKPSINEALNQPQPPHDRGTVVKREEEVR